LGGQALLPGFVDAHDHIFNDADAVGLSLDEAQALALQNGITSLGDLFVKADFLDTMRAFEQAGNLKIRTSLYLRYNSSCGVVIGDWYLSETPVTDTSLMLRVPGIKVFTDGGSCGLPAVTFDMAGQDPPQGDLWITTPELTQVIVDAQTAGYQVAIHSVGDRSRDVALDALEAALGGQPNLLRHRIEHNTLTRPDQIARYGSIGVVAVIWGYSQTCRELAAGSDSWAIQLAPDRLDWYWPWRDLIDQNPGLHVAWHGDFFVSTPLSHLNPINSLYGFVTRKQVSEDDGVTICDPPPHLAAQLVTVQEALHMMTSGSAYALGMDSVVGSLTPGKFADFVVLSDDPFAVAPDDLKDLAVHATVVGGATEYCAAGQSTVCGN